MLDKKLLEILVCPICKKDLIYDKDRKELICLSDSLAFPVKDGIPVMLEGEARRGNKYFRRKISVSFLSLSQLVMILVVFQENP